MTISLLDNLNKKQRLAAEQATGPLLILAGAGSGKTRVLTYRIAYILEKGLARPWELLAVTFTNKAAAEMKRRVEKLISVPVEGMWIGTFHSVCARILRVEASRIGYEGNFSIYDSDDQVRLIQQIMKSLNIDQQTIKARAVSYTISDSKNKMRGPREYEKVKAITYSEKQIARIFHEYEAALKRNNAFDFDDLLIKPLDIFTAHPEVLQKYQSKFRFVMVDEYQDTNRAQYYFIKLLSEAHRNICVVGDEDQSIYRWRGADIENILSFEKDYPESVVVRLEQNYRSTETILGAANAVVAHNLKRLGKNLWSEKKGGAKIQISRAGDESLEAQNTVNLIESEVRQHSRQYNDFAILYRTNAQSRALEDRLRRANVPYAIVGGTKFYERKEVKDVLGYLRVLVNPRDEIALRRIINFPARGIGLTTMQRLQTAASARGESLYDLALAADTVPEISSGAAHKVQEFMRSLEAFGARVDDTDAYLLASEVVSHYGLTAQYSLSTLPEDASRVENMNELMNSIASFSEQHGSEPGGLRRYLEDVALMTDVDRWDPSHDAVTLMTLHSAKGLEFPVVIITGLEDGLFPLFRTYDNADDLEEERRLFYVGMTRAMDKLYLQWASQRRRFSGENRGMAFRNKASKFLQEIPPQFKDGMSADSDGYLPESRHTRRFREGDPALATYAAEMVDAQGNGFKIGDWVLHDNFGKGQVLGIEKATNGTKLSILFEKRQLKKLIAEYANLEKVANG